MEALKTLMPEATSELHMRMGMVQDDDEKIAKAGALVEEGRIEVMAGEKERWEVIGSAGTIYITTTKSCTCKARRTSDTPYPCYHLLGVTLYRWVEEKMQKEGRVMYESRAAPGTPENGHSNAGEAGTSGDAEKAVQDQQRHTIRQLLTEFGLHLRTREEYIAAMEAHVGLTPDPENFAAIIGRLQEMVAARRKALPSPKLLQDYMVKVGDASHVKYAGLLAYAHEQGLISMVASLTTVTKELAVATATATFRDGRVFTETADATPENVKGMVKPHFPRMAVTRAKARALRDALNIGEAAAEELE